MKKTAKAKGVSAAWWFYSQPGFRAPAAVHVVGCVCEECSKTYEQDKRDPRG